MRKGQEGEVEFSTEAEGEARTGPAPRDEGFAPKKKTPRVGNVIGKVSEFLSKIVPIQILALIPGRQAKFTKLGKKIRKRYTKWH
ncbi:hypothetical protein LEP1GSC017_0671 [Leptospira meyeri serovar Hardjo str. Went 5]|nr:hypothetical protein LEP1GSC017_0671 [Leptospira meyeri serovar Hardjo str. Went 5]